MHVLGFCWVVRDVTCHLACYVSFATFITWLVMIANHVHVSPIMFYKIQMGQTIDY
jgi:hypothetical protein